MKENRVLKFRAWNGKEMLQDIIPMNNYAITRVQGLENTTSYCYYVPVEKIMQFTELKDTNDVEIYEGDIMTFTDYKSKLTIIFNYGAFGYLNEGNLFISLCESNINEIIVIGNIYNQ